MPWSPPKKFTVQISFLMQVIGIGVAFLGSGMSGMDQTILDIIPFISDVRLLGLIGSIICFLAWIFLMLGVMYKNI